MTASVREARAKLSKLLETAAGGEEVVITSHGKPRAKLIGLSNDRDGKLDLQRIRRLAKKGQLRRSGPDATQIVSKARSDR